MSNRPLPMAARYLVWLVMTNHVHLLLTPARTESAGLLMKHLGQRYVQYINRSYRRTGTLWEGRFRSCLSQSENYVLSCYRYIELNPVRAGMVEQPGDYRWSSYGANAEGKVKSLIMPHEEYLGLGHNVAARRSAYRALFRAHLDPERIAEIRKATNGNYALGNDRFMREIEEMLQRRVSPGRSGRQAKVNEIRGSYQSFSGI